MQQHSSHDLAAVCELVTDKNTCPKVNQHLVEDRGGVQLKCGCELPYAGCLMVGHKAEVPQKCLDVLQGRAGDQVDVFERHWLHYRHCAFYFSETQRYDRKKEVLPHVGWNLEAG